jgi:hypothetical protein
MNPTNLLIEIFDADDPSVEDVYPLDAVSDGFIPPGEAGELIRQHVKQRQCEKVRVVKLVTDEFFLRWDERHPETVSQDEYTGVREVDTGRAKYQGEDFYRAKRREHRKLYDVLPSRRREKPLTRQQAFGLVMAATADNASEFAKEFELEIADLWPIA